jgi:AraC family transcriptional activator of pobA
MFHPDFIRHHPLGKAIKRFDFFSYESDEDLHLSEKGKQVILGSLKLLEDGLSTPLDECSQNIVIAHLETLLNYSNRFYKRQFTTHKTANHDFLSF